MNVIGFGGPRDMVVSDSLISQALARSRFQLPDFVWVGDCPTGVDPCVHLWAELEEIDYDVKLADWDYHGLKAGPIRNLDIVKATKKIIVFQWSNEPWTKGGLSLARIALEHKRKLYIHHVSEDDKRVYRGKLNRPQIERMRF